VFDSRKAILQVAKGGSGPLVEFVAELPPSPSVFNARGRLRLGMCVNPSTDGSRPVGRTWSELVKKLLPPDEVLPTVIEVL
jgi:hypothetical protein